LVVSEVASAIAFGFALNRPTVLIVAMMVSILSSKMGL